MMIMIENIISVGSITTYFNPYAHKWKVSILSNSNNTYLSQLFKGGTFKDTLWVLRRDEPLVHVSIDISLITKHILDHDISLES